MKRLYTLIFLTVLLAPSWTATTPHTWTAKETIRTDYLNSMTQAILELQASLGLTAKADGTGAHGKWPIDISGTASNVLDGCVTEDSLNAALKAKVNAAAGTEIPAANIVGYLSVGQGGTGTTNTQANKVFAGPVSGADHTPAFRALVADDIPATIDSDTTGNAATATTATSATTAASVTTVPASALAGVGIGVPRSGIATYTNGTNTATLDVTAHPPVAGSLLYAYWNGFKRPFSEVTYGSNTITVTLGLDPDGAQFTFLTGDLVEVKYDATN